MRYSLFALSFSFLSASLVALSPEEIEAYLVSWHTENWEYKEEDLAKFQKEDIATLATFLNGKYAFHAHHAMVGLDRELAGRNFLALFTRCDWQEKERIAHFIATESGAENFPKTEARRLLLDGLTELRFNHHMVLALGTVGLAEDIVFIRLLHEQRLQERRQSWEMHYQRSLSWDQYVRHTNDPARWACARLGDQDALRQMSDKLLPPESESPEFRSRAAWTQYAREMKNVSFVRRFELLPALKPSLRYVIPPPRIECFSLFQSTPPPIEAMQVLTDIVPKALHPNDPTSPAQWIDVIDKLAGSEAKTETGRALSASH